MSVALITGASRGLGLALARELASQGWNLILDARGAQALEEATSGIASGGWVTAIPGDVTDPAHIAALADEVHAHGRLDLLINNASTLGGSPMPLLGDYAAHDLDRVFAVNVTAPVALTQALLPELRESRGTVVNLSSDAAVEAYEGWGGYGASKAALDHVSAIWSKEEPDVRFLSFDPGDMRTQMHQEAFPGEDISDRPEPESVVPALLYLIGSEVPSGRYRGSELLIAVGAAL